MKKVYIDSEKEETEAKLYSSDADVCTEMRQFGKRIFAVIMMVCVVMSYSNFAFAGEISIESENLNDVYEAKVTMAIPSEEVQLASDVVFVLDNSSCRDYVSKAWSDMLIDLADAATSSGAKIRLSIVNFRGIADSTALTEVNSSNITSILEAAKANADKLESNPDTSIGKGSNLHAGLLEAEKVLASDTSVDNSRKYVVVISDGNTYTWLENGEQYGLSFSNGESVFFANPESISVFKGAMAWSPEGNNWSAYFDSSKASEIESVSAEYGIKYSRTKEEYEAKYISKTDTDVETVQVALYKCLTEYKTLLASGYNCYAVDADPYGYYGGLFMNYLNSISTSTTVDFTQIKNDILYYMGKGSYVENYLGYVDGDYNLDLDTSKDMELNVTSADGSKKSYSVKYKDGAYTFYNTNGEVCNDYALDYYPEDDANEKFIWTFNENVSSFDRLALSYTVKLINPKKANPGEELTFGEYDKYGTNNLPSLYTNNGAKLYMKVYNSATGESTDGDILTFNRPTVSYTVSEPVHYVPGHIDDPDDPEEPIDPHDLPDDDDHGRGRSVDPDDSHVVDPDNQDGIDADSRGDGTDFDDEIAGDDVDATAKGVETGDSTDMILWALCFGSAIMLLGGAVALRRREE